TGTGLRRGSKRRTGCCGAGELFPDESFIAKESIMIADRDICTSRPQLSAAQRALLEKRLRGGFKTGAKGPIIRRRTPARHAPLSFAQQRLWFFYQLVPESPLYNVCVALRLEGRLDRQALEKSLSAIVARHESLRTRFFSLEGEPVQLIDDPPKLPLQGVDLKGASNEHYNADIQRLFREEAVRPFDLSNDLMLRATLARLGESDHVL